MKQHYQDYPMLRQRLRKTLLREYPEGRVGPIPFGNSRYHVYKPTLHEAIEKLIETLRKEKMGYNPFQCWGCHREEDFLVVVAALPLTPSYQLLRLAEDSVGQAHV